MLIMNTLWQEKESCPEFEHSWYAAQKCWQKRQQKLKKRSEWKSTKENAESLKHSVPLNMSRYYILINYIFRSSQSRYLFYLTLTIDFESKLTSEFPKPGTVVSGSVLKYPVVSGNVRSVLSEPEGARCDVFESHRIITESHGKMEHFTNRQNRYIQRDVVFLRFDFDPTTFYENRFWNRRLDSIVIKKNHHWKRSQGK